MRAKKDIRLFFALWPGETERESISRTLLDFDFSDCRLVPEYNLHMTLHFIGNVSFADRHCLHQAAKQLKAEEIILQLDMANIFSKPAVFWLGCRTTPPALISLQQDLGSRLSDCGFEAEKRPFTPHVSVARKYRRDFNPCSIDPIPWEINRFVLVESQPVDTGVRYNVLESYALDSG